jgi:HAMP domain-containing protein
VLRPLRQITRHADEVSLGQATEMKFTGGNDEIGALGEAFERMRKSLEKAMKLIGGPGRGA